MNVQALRERRNHLANEARQLLKDTENKSWTSDHQATYDRLTAEIVALDGQLDRHQRVLDLDAERTFEGLRAEAGTGEIDPQSDRGIYSTWLRRGDNGLSAEQLQRLQNTLSTTTPAEGGYTVQTEVARSIVEAMKAYGGMRSVAQVLVTSTGNPLSFPTTDGTSEEGEILAENQPASDEDVSFGTVGLNVFKYSSKIITVPIELLQDSAIDVEALVRSRMVSRLGRITNKHFTVGTGTGQPMGLVTAAGVGKVGATGQTTTVLHDDLADLLESVDEAYLEQGNCRWTFHQQMRRVLRKLKDTSGRPIWTPGYDLGITAGTPDLLLGHEVKINNHMPVPGANAKSIAFGDLSKYTIRDALQISLFRFTDSVYTRKGQVGFLAWARSGGNLIDTSAIKTYQHAAS